MSQMQVRFFYCLFFIYKFVFIYIKMWKDSSARYFKKTKKGFKKS